MYYNNPEYCTIVLKCNKCGQTVSINTGTTYIMPHCCSCGGIFISKEKRIEKDHIRK